MSAEIEKYWGEKQSIFGDRTVSYPFLPNHSIQGESEILTINSELSERIYKISGEDEMKNFVFLTSVIQISLARYFQKSEIVVMTPPVAGIDAGKAFLVPVCSSIDFEAELKTLIGACGANCGKAFRYQNYVSAFMSAKANEINADFLIYSRGLHRNYTCGQNTRFVVEINTEVRNIQIRFSDLSGAKTDFLAGFLKLTQRVLEHLSTPEVKLREISWYDDQELRNRLEALVQDGERNIPASLVELFEQQVERSPDMPALTFEDKTYSYRSLNEKVNGFADYLIQEYNIVPGSCVPLFLDKTDAAFIAILAILKCRAFYVPIRKGVLDIELELILNELDSNLIITEMPHFERLFRFEKQLLALDVELDACPENNTNPCIDSSTDYIAYIMYTSGSTGVPKGVLAKQSGIVNMIYNNPFNTSVPERNILQLSPYHFDGSVFDLFTALLSGARLYVVSDEVMMNPPLLVDFMEQNEINQMLIMTPLLNQLADHKPEIFNRFEAVYFGGQEASVKHLLKIMQSCSNNLEEKLIHVYGATEGTIFNTYHPLTFSDLQNLNISIGKPISGTGVLTMDGFGHLTYPFVEGELYIAGKAVAEGYWKDASKTSEKFIEKPEYLPGKLYRTGDYGMLDEKDCLYFLGRKDGQVQVRGFRIEIGEIINTLQKHPQLEDLHISIKEDELTGNKELIGYYKGNITPADLRAFASENLALYKVPSYFMQLDEIPLKPNGKTDESKLPVLSDVKTVSTPPENDIEKVIAGIWEEIFGLKHIGRNDNFFELGGQSIKGMHVMMHISDRLGVAVQIADIFKYPVLSELAAYVSQGKAGGLPPIEKAPHADKYALSFHQTQLWISEKFGQKSAYNTVFNFKISGSLDPASLEKALNKVIAANEILRTVIKEERGTPFQVILDTVSVPVSLELAESTEAAVQKVKSLLKTEQEKSFDLQEGPLFRLVLINDGTQHFAVFTIHHLIFDPESVDILLSEVLKHYKQIEEGGEAAAPTEKLQFKDFSVWYNNLLETGELDGQKSYWLSKIEGYDKIHALNPEDISGEGLVIHFEQELSMQLEELAKKYNTTVFTCLYALFQVYIYQYAKISKLVIAMPGSFRLNRELSEMMGYFINLVPVSSHLTGEMSLENVILNSKETIRESLDNRMISSNVLLNELRNKYGESYHPFDTTMTYVDKRENETIACTVNDDTIEITPSDVEGDQTISRFNMEFIAVHFKDEIQMQVMYKPSVYSASDILEMKDFMFDCIGLILEDGTMKLSEMDLKSESSKKQSDEPIKLNINFS